MGWELIHPRRRDAFLNPQEETLCVSWLEDSRTLRRELRLTVPTFRWIASTSSLPIVGGFLPSL